MPRLDDPLTINGVLLRNRLVLPPITTCYGTPEGQVTDDVVGFYGQRARHVGLVVVEAAAIRPDGRITPRSLGVWADGQIPGLRRLAQAIKGEGAAAVLQIVHAGSSAVVVQDGVQRASPSGVPTRPAPEPSILSEGQIREIVDAFADGAARAAEAGFDGVEIHGAHFYLVSQFLSPLTNLRQDRYGGDAAGRATFAVEIVEAVRRRLGRGFPVLFRMNTVELVDGGQSVADSIVVAQLLERAGVDVIHSSLIAMGGWKEEGGVRFLQTSSALPKEQPSGAAVPYAAELKRSIRVPVIAVGKLGDPAVCARVVEEGLVDMVAIGRQMIADPLSAEKILSGRGSDMVLCRECRSCFASIGKGQPMVCCTNRNPAGIPTYA